jgi:predicted Rossmann fold flavoprotein
VEKIDIIVIGGGAAGLMCAIAAGKRGRSVLVLEGSNKIGKKILMSGGGRCNFTNLNTQPSNFLSSNPHFCKSALSRYTPYDFLEMVESYNIPYHEKTAGQLFCDNSSKDILNMLVAECDNAGVRIVTECEIRSVSRSNGYDVSCAQGRYLAESLVVATGGLSIPKMGASDFGYRLAKQFELDTLETRAGLVPFAFTGATHELFGRLAGVSVPAVLETGSMLFADDILFTHRGLSGPAALQLSSYWKVGDEVSINLLPSHDVAEILVSAKAGQPRVLIRSVLSDFLPRALVLELQGLMWPDLSDTPLGEISDKMLVQIAAQLHSWSVRPSGTEGYRTAEVTLGGVNTDELSSRTMEATRHPGLYFIGEVVDVTGHLGGFNFQWAWASASAAGSVA